MVPRYNINACEFLRLQQMVDEGNSEVGLVFESTFVLSLFNSSTSGIASPPSELLRHCCSISRTEPPKSSGILIHWSLNFIPRLPKVFLIFLESCVLLKNKWYSLIILKILIHNMCTKEQTLGIKLQNISDFHAKNS